MAQIVTHVSDYTGDTITNEEAVSVKLTLKVGNEAVKSYELDFSKEEYQELIEKLDTTVPGFKGKHTPILPKSKPSTNSGPAQQSGNNASGTPRANHYKVLMELLNNEAKLDREAVVKEVQAIDSKVDTSKRLPVDYLKTIVKDKGLSDKAAELGVNLDA